MWKEYESADFFFFFFIIMLSVLVCPFFLSSSLLYLAKEGTEGEALWLRPAGTVHYRYWSCWGIRPQTVELFIPSDLTSQKAGGERRKDALFSCWTALHLCSRKVRAEVEKSAWKVFSPLPVTQSKFLNAEFVWGNQEYIYIYILYFLFPDSVPSKRSPWPPSSALRAICQ